VSALFPLALWMLYLGFRKGKNWSWGAFALIIGLCVLSPHPQLLQYTLLAAGAYSLFLALASLDGVKLPRDVAIKRLGVALIAVVVGLAIGAVQYLPVREYVKWSPRAGGFGDYTTATSYAWPPDELLNAYLPQFSGMLNNYSGPNGIHLHSDYVGVVVLILAGAAFIGLRGDPRRKHIIFWSVTLLVTVLWSLGGATPFYRIPYEVIPGTKYFRAPATIFFVGTLAIALLAATGTERFLQLRVSRKYLFGWAIGGLLIVLLASTGVLSSIAESFAHEQLIDRVAANRSALIFGAWRSLAFILLVLGLWFALTRGKISSKAAALALVALTALDLWTVEHVYWMFMPPAKVIYASDATVEALRKEPQPGRVFAFQIRPSPQRDVFLTGDALMTHRIRLTSGYHGNEIGRYATLIGENSSPDQLFNPNVLQLTNTQYFLTNIPELPFVQGTTLMNGPVLNASGDSVYLFRVTKPNPYSWVTPVAVKAPDDQVLATILNPRFELTRAALFDTSANVTVAQGIQSLPPALSIKTSVRHYEPGKVQIDLDAPAPQGASLIVSENYYPGWTAAVDGKPARIGRADYTMIGVELPAGARSVELNFTSPTYQKGKMITWIAIALGFLMLGAGVWRDRRRLA